MVVPWCILKVPCQMSRRQCMVPCTKYHDSTMVKCLKYSCTMVPCPKYYGSTMVKCPKYHSRYHGNSSIMVLWSNIIVKCPKCTLYHGSIMVPHYYYYCGIYYGILDILPWYFRHGMDITSMAFRTFCQGTTMVFWTCPKYHIRHHGSSSIMVPWSNVIVKCPKYHGTMFNTMVVSWHNAQMSWHNV